MEILLRDYLCCPECKGVLDPIEPDTHFDDYDEFRCTHCNLMFTDSKGYLNFIPDGKSIFGSWQEKIVRSMYASFYTPLTDLMFAFCGGAAAARTEVIERLLLRKGDVVLETGIGPGDNFPLLDSRAVDLSIFGIDIQEKMLIQCVKNCAKWKIRTKLFKADAQFLPFRKEVFDVVFHLGAFNLFDDRRLAVNEMIRVAKPGVRIVIADESEKGDKFFTQLTGTKSKYADPLEFIPETMINVRKEIIWRGYGYVVSFTKP